MSSYAPLFANYAYTQWNPDLIGYDQTSSFGSTSKGVFSYLVPANSLTVVRVAR
jgi:hypothetical protein